MPDLENVDEDGIPNLPDIPPVFIDEDPPQDDDGEVEETAAPTETPRPRRPPRRAREVASQVPQQAQSLPRVRQYTDDDADYDTWSMSVEWDKPGMYMKLERTSPPYFESKPVAGFLGKSPGRPFRSEEILERWGGGEFKATVIGPQLDPRRGKETIRVLKHKTFSIAGDPIAGPQNAQDLLSGNSHGPAGQRQRLSLGSPQREPDEGLTAMRLVGEQFRNLQQRSDRAGQTELATLNLIKDNCNESVSRIRDAERERADAAVLAADQRAKESLARENHYREEKERLEKDLREREKQMLEEKSKYDANLAERLSKAQGDSTGFLSVMIPQISREASEQVKHMSQLYESRLAASETAHQTALQQLYANHSQQVKALETLYEGRLDASRQDAKNTIAMFERQIESIKAERDHLARNLDDARREAQKARDDLMQQVIASKTPRSPTEQMGDMAAFAEGFQTIRSVVGGGGNGEGAEGGEEPGGVMGLANKFLAVVPELLAQRRAAQEPQPGTYSEEQVRTILAQQQAAFQQQIQTANAPRRLPRPPQARHAPSAGREFQAEPLEPAPQEAQDALPKKVAKLPSVSREAVMPAIDFLNTILSTNDHGTPEEIAAGALNVIQDRGMLKALAYRNPDRLVAEFIQKGVITPEMPLHTVEGQAYLKALLLALRTHLAPP